MINFNGDNDNDMSIWQLMDSDAYRYQHEQQMRRDDELMREIEISERVDEYKRNEPIFLT